MIVNATVGDLPEIHRLISVAIRASVASDAVEEQALLSEIDKILAWWTQHQDKCIHIKYLIDEVIVGMALVKDFWNLACVFVAPEHQRRGIGKLLVEEILARCKTCSLCTHAKVNSSTNAVAFYESLGFVRSGPARDLPGGCVPLRLDF